MQSKVFPLSNGSRIYFDPRFNFKKSETALLIYGINIDPLLLPLNLNGTLSKNSAEILLKRSIASYEKSKIFSNPALCKAIFNWSTKPELDALLGLFNYYNAKNILDVGCGYGRLLIPIFKENISIWGIDESLPLVTDLNQSLGVNTVRAFCSDMATFIMPNVIDFAFSAMNTIRYLEDIATIKRHLISMSNSVKKKGKYLLNFTFSPETNENYCHRWDFIFNNQSYFCEWKFESYCHLLNQVIDKISIYTKDNMNESLYLQEFQIQAHINAEIFKSMLSDIGDIWQIIKVMDSKWMECNFEDNLSGNYSVLLEKN